MQHKDPWVPSSESIFSTRTTPTTQIFRLEECSEQHPEINRVVGSSRSVFTFIIGKSIQLLVFPIDLCYYWVHLIMFLDKVGWNRELCAISASSHFSGSFFPNLRVFRVQSQTGGDKRSSCNKNYSRIKSLSRLRWISKIKKNSPQNFRTYLPSGDRLWNYRLPTLETKIAKSNFLLSLIRVNDWNQ